MGLADDLGFGDPSPPTSGVIGLFSGRLIVCGSGRCLWDDLKKVWNPESQVMAIKQSGLYLPFRFQHWAGAHGERFQYMVPMRREGYYFRGIKDGVRGVHAQKLGAKIHSDKQWPLVDYVWPCQLVGTSALFGVRVGLMMGFDEIVLCGVPLDNTGRFYEAPWDAGIDLNVVDMREWEKFLPIMQGRVRSMSGRTRELLGGV